MSLFLRLLPAAALLSLPTLAAGFAYTASTPDGIRQNQSSGQPIIWSVPQQSFVFNFNELGPDFNANAISAMEDRNGVGTPLQYQLGTTAGQACDSSDQINSASWSTTTCNGQQFGDALAVTKRSYQKIGDTWYLNDADIFLDKPPSRSWVPHYAGPLRQDPNTGQQIRDFRRVILHELGHALGLDHPDDAQQIVAAIMNSHTSDIDSLRQDDGKGINSLYSGNATSNIANQTVESNGGGGGGGDFVITLLALAAMLMRPVKRRGL